MKKLTAGIFSVLMGLVAVNAADAAVASKGYVTGQIKAVNESINTVSQDLAGYKTDNDAAVALKAEKTYVDTELGEKQNTLNVTGGVLTWDAATSTLGLTGIATSGSLETLQTTVNTLNGAETVDGSVKKQIADAIAGEVSRADGLYATQQGLAGLTQTVADNKAAADEELAKKEVLLNKLTDTYTTEDLSSADKYMSAKVVSAYVQDKIDTLSNNTDAVIQGLQDDVSALESATGTNATNISANTQAITNLPTTLDGTFVSETEMNTFKGENTQAIANAKSGAEATAATYTDDSIAALALQSISRVPMECSEPTKYCALTTNGTQFVWEVIERDFDEETVPAGTPVTLATKDANPNK